MDLAPIEVAREFYEASDRNDRDAVLALMTEDVEIVSIGIGASGVDRIGSGHEGMRRWWEQMDARGNRAHVFVRETFEEAGRVVCCVVLTHSREGTSPNIASSFWTVLTLAADNRIAATWSFRTRAEALEAARAGRP